MKIKLFLTYLSAEGRGNHKGGVRNMINFSVNKHEMRSSAMQRCFSCYVYRQISLFLSAPILVGRMHSCI